MNTLKEARRLYECGFAILILHPKSKRPIASGWTTGERASWDEIKSSFKEGCNIGVRTGLASKIGENYLACIDVDVKDPAFKDRALECLGTLIDDCVCPEVSSGSGNGSRHLYCVTKKPFKMLTIEKHEGWEICVYSSGRQMVLPPSTHPNGKLYKWVKELASVSSLPLIEFDVPVEAVKESKVREGKEAVHFTFTLKPVDLEWLPISDEVKNAIIAGIGVTDRSAYLLTATTALLSAELDRDEILSVLTDPKYFISDAARNRRGLNRVSQAAWLWDYTVKAVMTERSVKEMFNPISEESGEKELSPEQIEAQNKELADERSWKQDLDRTQYGKTKVSLRNLNIILTNTVEGALFKKDMFANRIAYGVDAPWGPKANEYIDNIDVTLIKHWFGEGEFNIEPSKDALYEVTDLIAHHQRVHPVREWLESLKWDGKPRINSWLKKYCEAEAEEPYLSEVSRKFLLAMVKRVFEPGCQWDYTLVLEGDQGKYKSSIARALASDKWFMDNLPDLRDKDAMLNLQGKWLIELGELTNVKRSDFNLVKQYLIRRIDTVRPHYGRLMSDVPRQSVFIGTVNDGQYLKDPTGNRRFWPVRVGHCDVKGLNKVREQLFAEAFCKYKDEALMLTPEATKQAVEAQDERRIDDDNVTMEEALKEFISSDTGKSFNFDKFKAKDLFMGANAPWGAWSNKNYAFQTASQVLKNMGFVRRKIHGQRVWRSAESNVKTIEKSFGTGGGVGADPKMRELDFF